MKASNSGGDNANLVDLRVTTYVLMAQVGLATEECTKLAQGSKQVEMHRKQYRTVQRTVQKSQDS